MDPAAWFHAQLDERGSAVQVVGEGAWPSRFSVTGLSAGSVASAGAAVARLVDAPDVTVDRGLASHWFLASLRPQGWSPPAIWDAIAGDYPTRDGWIKLHTNAVAHRDAALAVLGVEGERELVAAAVRAWDATSLESAVVDAGGCAAEMRSVAEWAAHPQGAAVAAEPILARRSGSTGPSRAGGPRDRPLAGVRVLDLTRVLAGPVATRFLAGLGADVIRVDPIGRDEPGVEMEVTLGKRLIRLDARAGLEQLRALLAGADILVHGYRSGALDRMGLDESARADLAPGLVDVSLCAYGHTGPWAERRGFDSLVQMSSGIAHADRPVPLPVQALDHATGYLLAMAAIDGWSDRLRSGVGTIATASLARMARLLVDGPAGDPAATLPSDPADVDPTIEQTSWGPAHRLRPPVVIAGTPLRWDLPARALGADGTAAWR